MNRLLISSLLLSFGPWFSQGFVPSTSIQRRHEGSFSIPLMTKRSSSLKAVAPEALQEAWTSYNNALESNPLLVKSLTAGVILGAADLAGQVIQDVTSQKETVRRDIDVGRTARFALFGLVLQAPWNHFYYQILDGAIPPTPEPWTATTAVKTVIDQFVQAPVFTILIFAFLGFLEGKNTQAIQKQLQEDYKDTMIANWKLWVPATVVNLAFVPPILRVLYLNVVFFFWSIFLSLKLNKEEE
ncbi:Mpv17 / PMP22 family protein [Nitzschia inconspicua]|uniref:Mpv17 / PMP22 family protein n=1 Tax=Nitzschia inconspicua TaxID=303405 RepID=A0A9K3LBS9_9STRA|nr:Mpv17 / PMP22 family protein [Nitzschia inconspicua]KAG7359389.1 Mpv17 / PMP22 family protein [Nitzschia inconspicua]